MKFRFSIDRGGTFCDVFCEYTRPDGTVGHSVEKLLSVCPGSYADAPTEGIRRVLRRVLLSEGAAVDASASGVPGETGPVPTEHIEWVRMGTTVATNALLERDGERFALVTNEGFRDLARIGNQSRPDIFDLEIRRREGLPETVVEVPARVRVLTQENGGVDGTRGGGGGGGSGGGDSGAERPSKRARTQGNDAGADERGGADDAPHHATGQVVVGTTGEEVLVETALDRDAVLAVLRPVRESGIRALAVSLLHAYTYPWHELEIARIAKEELGFEHVSVSSGTIAMTRAVPRTLTTCVDAYLTPKIREYVRTFTSGFDEGISSGKCPVLFMQSDGGLTEASAFAGHRSILSGPAGGVVGFSATAYSGAPAAGSEFVQLGLEPGLPVIGFDMGGTSTDVSRFAGSLEHVYDARIAGVDIQSPQLDVHTVAAGGGSLLEFHAGLFHVGPGSARAFPGPVCYRNEGGKLAVTDANAALGRLAPSLFPAIFGPGGDQPLDVDAAARALDGVTEQVNRFYADKAEASGLPKPRAMSRDEVAEGFLRVANEAMCRPIRQITQSKGFDTSKHSLACFGGAGGQHACAVARSLGMKQVIVHRFAGILSAVGLGMAEIVEERQGALGSRDVPAQGPAPAEAVARLGDLEAAARGALRAAHGDSGVIAADRFLLMRYRGTDVATIVPEPADGDFYAAFVAQHKREFGFTLGGREVVADVARVRARLSTAAVSVPDMPAAEGDARPEFTQSTFFGDGVGRVDTPVYLWDKIGSGGAVDGPAIVVSGTSTVVVEPHCRARMGREGTLVVDIGTAAVPSTARAAEANSSKAGLADLDAVRLSIFSHRFMSIAEQMGRTLQRTSVSTNIKERLDFSCALFAPDGALVSNAPSIPVHLGAMSEAVRHQISLAGDDLRPGDVLVCNHPAFGGSHLPDITVITPVFETVAEDGREEIVFFVASRGHHADIGGTTPGSMPPFSHSIHEEGACIKSLKLVEAGEFQEDRAVRALCDFPKDIPAGALDPSGPPVVGTRNLADNLSDLRAQVAANQRGISLARELVAEYSLPVVQAYMGHVQNAATDAVRAMLVRISLDRGLGPVGTLEAEDCMDDGTPVRVAVTIDRSGGPASASAVFDFAGTGHEVVGNWNAPRAITYSSVIYCLRSLVDRDVPLNQGCLSPVEIRIPDGSILSPSIDAAVVGGNVLTSMRVTDVILAAMGACAGSQGCLNNVTFGTEKVGYYETIAGGAGAGPHWHGQSAVHSHMSNTRITDAEILERRYPVVLREFSVREGSGGDGEFRGGCGVVRELEFTEPVRFSVLSERRAVAPRGLCGGGNGAMGVNLLISADGKTRNLGGKNSVLLKKGDRVRIMTPGAGGYGSAPQ